MWRNSLSSDDSQIIELCESLYREDPSTELITKENTARTLAALRSDPTRGKAIVLDLSSKLCGYALLISFWSNELGGEVCVVDELYVSPSARGQGHASQLMSELQDGTTLWPGKLVAIELEVTPQNAKARALYSKLGFANVKNSPMRLRMR